MNTIEDNTCILGDCLEVMQDIGDKSIDMILCDLPYGTTACRWDVVIPFKPLWEQYERIIKDNGAIVLFGSQPFTTDLINSNRKIFRYEIIWDKIKPSGMFNANKMPMKSHENIEIFYKKLPTFNPQKTEREKKNLRPNRVSNSIKRPYQSSGCYVGKNIKFSKNYEENRINPKTILRFITTNNFSKLRIHPTQKPVELFEYLIKTYTNAGDLVLDNCSGSGTTGIACLNLGDRDYILIEKDLTEYQKGLNRLNEHKLKLSEQQKQKTLIK